MNHNKPCVAAAADVTSLREVARNAITKLIGGKLTAFDALTESKG